jgi:hypothetical protein
MPEWMTELSALVPDAVQRKRETRSGAISAFTRVFDALWLIRDRS